MTIERTQEIVDRLRERFESSAAEFGEENLNEDERLFGDAHAAFVALRERVRLLEEVAEDAVKALPVLINLLRSARLPAGQIVGEGMLEHARAALKGEKDQ
jgi:hypothetical protein